MLILPKGDDSMGARRMWNRRSVAVVADPLPSTSIQFHAFTPKRAGDLVVASAGCPSTAAAAPPRQTERRFKRSSEFGRSVGCICRRVSLSCHCPLKSPFVCPLCQRAECGLLLLHLLFHLRIPAEQAEERRGEKGSRNPLCPFL